MSQKKHVCFYSNKDKWSKAFLEELSKSPWMSQFEFTCVDPTPSGARPPLPKWLKQVPTLYIEGDQSPIKVDAEVMNWLYERKMKESSRSNTAVKAQDGPESWLSTEMGGFAEANYSFLDSDTSTAGNGGETIPGNFSFLNGNSSPGDRQSQASLTTTSANSGKTKKEVMFDSQMEMYKQQRDQGIPQGIPRQ
jgi:hypothetical protein